MPQKSFDTHLAETGQQTRLNELRRTGGYEAAKKAYEGGGAPTTPKVATQTASTGGKDYGGWYDNPATGRNQRWWGAGVWTDGDDPGAPKSEGGVTPYLNKYQDGIFKAQDRPQVKVETMEELGKKLIPEGGYPAQLDRVAKFEKLREERGMEGLEQSLVDLKAQEEEVFATLRQRKAGERGKRVATGVIAGRITKVEQQERENLDFVQRQKARIIDEINMGYSVINQYMNFYGLDYNDAVDRYNTEFNQNFSMYGLILDQEKLKVDQWYKDQVIASTNLQMFVNAVTKGNLDYAGLPEDQKVMIAKLEAQSGLPVGFIGSIRKDADADIIFTSTTKGITTVGFRNRDGTISTQDYGTYRGSEGETKTGIKKNAFAEIERKLRELGGSDLFVSPEEWKFVRSAWAQQGYAVKEFDDAYQSRFVGDAEDRGFDLFDFGIED